MTEKTVPEGFEPIEHVGPFLEMFGPIYVKKEGKRHVLGMRVEHKHLNSGGIAHGGMLVSFADSALGVNLGHWFTPPLPMVTVNLSTDFALAAELGDWIEAHVDIQKVGASLAFANCYLHAGKKRILRASGVFAILVASAATQQTERFDG